MAAPTSLTQRQHRMRRTGIGASETAAVMGKHPFLTRLDVYNAKVGQAVGDAPPRSAGGSDRRHMRAGIYLEQGIAQMYIDATGIALHRGSTRRHREHSWLIATPDRYAIVNGMRSHLVEIKLMPTAANSHGVFGDLPDEIPEHIALQVQHQMLVTDMSRCDVSVFFLDTCDFRIYPQTRQEGMIRDIVKVNRRFWNDHIVRQIPPRN